MYPALGHAGVEIHVVKFFTTWIIFYPYMCKEQLEWLSTNDPDTEEM